jgi:hypothetical protein
MPSIERASRAERESLFDDRGVVAISGLAMAVFLTGVLYYEIGVGDAITFKEQLQDASDASGFSAAVYHARGMNMIVLINLIMAAVLAVIVILRVLQVVVGILIAIASLLCALLEVEVCPTIEPLGELEGWLSETADALDPIVHTALMGLNDVATAVAVGMPWVALIKSGTVGAQYYPQVTSSKGGGTIMLSVSLMPGLSWIPPVASLNNAAKDGANSGLGLDNDKESNIANNRWGLPVMEGEYNDLCAQAAIALPDLLEYAVAAGLGLKNTQPPSWVTWINAGLSALIGSFPNYFCDAAAMGVTPDPTDDIEKDANTLCGDQSKAFDACLAIVKSEAIVLVPTSQVDPCGNGVIDLVEAAQKKAGAKGTPTFDKEACVDEEKEKLTEAAKSQAQTMKESPLPKAIYSYAANGNDYMAIWSFGWGDFKNQEEQGISVAQWSKAGLSAPNPQHTTMLTKAEFFYSVEDPCDTPGQEEGTKGSSALCGTSLNLPYWGDYAGDTMWNPRWVARLRRVAPPMIPIGQMASSGLSGLLGNALDKGFGMIPGASSTGGTYAGPGISPTGSGAASGTGVDKGAGADWIKEFITGFIQIGGGEADSALAGQIEKAAGYEH